MEYQKIRNLLDLTTNQPSKFRTRYWVEINDEFKEHIIMMIIIIIIIITMMIIIILN